MIDSLHSRRDSRETHVQLDAREPAATRHTQRYLRVVWSSALYDLLVTALFATPWTADLALGNLRRLHDALGVGGANLPGFGAAHLFFVSLFGTVVVMWAMLRLHRPRPEHGLTDAAGRFAFSAWMLLALATGQTLLFVAFLIPELAWGVAQLRGYIRWNRAETRPLASLPV
jgi:hypothetical protein